MSCNYNISINFICTSRTFPEAVSKEYYTRARFLKSIFLSFSQIWLVAFIALRIGCPVVRRQTVTVRVGLIMARCISPRHQYFLCVHTTRSILRAYAYIERQSTINQIVQTWYWRLLYVVIDVIMTRRTRDERGKSWIIVIGDKLILKSRTCAITADNLARWLTVRKAIRSRNI